MIGNCSLGTKVGRELILRNTLSWAEWSHDKAMGPERYQAFRAAWWEFSSLSSGRLGWFSVQRRIVI